MLTVHNPNTFKWDEISLHDCALGNAVDTFFTLKLFNILDQEIHEQGMEKLMYGLLSPLQEVFTEIEYNGLDVSLENLSHVEKNLNKIHTKVHDSLYNHEAVDKTDNISSQEGQVGILFEKENGLNLYPPIRTSKWAPSASKQAVEILMEQIEDELESR